MLYGSRGHPFGDGQRCQPGAATPTRREQVAIGEDAEQSAIRMHDDDGPDAVQVHEPEGHVEGAIRIDRHRIRLHYFANGQDGSRHRVDCPLCCRDVRAAAIDGIISTNRRVVRYNC